jgi:tetratricopeptide (TPR) repeat protein
MSMRVRVLTALTTLLAFAMTLVWPGGARAQEPPPPPTGAPPPPPATPPPPPAAASDDAIMAQAKQHFEAGRNAYNAGDYPTAIREFKAAEALRASPILDYNIGLAHEKLGRKRVAVKYYRRYLNLQPNARNKDEVEQRINGLEAQIAQEPPPATTAQPGGTAPQPNNAETPADMPPPDTTAPAPQPGYDPYASPPPPGYAVQPVKKKKSYWWIGLIIAGAATLTVVAIVLAVYFGTPSSSVVYAHSPSLAPNLERIDRRDVGVTLFRF